MNDSLAESWATLIQKFEALNQRERWMIFGAVLCVFYALFSFLISPVLARQQVLKSELASDQAQEQNLKIQLNTLTQQNLIDPDLGQKQRITALESNLRLLDSEINSLKNTLISPEKMPDLLSDLLKGNTQLKLISLKTLPTKGLLETEVTAESTSGLANKNLNNLQTNTQDLPIFKHGVEMTIEGRYLDLLDYVSGIEKMPWHVLWNSANLKVETDPKNAFPLSQLTLTVYTLSLDKTWLSI